MTNQNTAWYDLLEQLTGRVGLTRPQIAKRANLSSKTITSWLRGDVKSPRRWQPIAQLLKAINANQTEANAVLQGAGHPPIHKLAKQATDKDYQLLTPWLQSDVPFMPPDRLTHTLVGRTAELTQATTILKRQKRCVLLGMGGVGKTTLAVELAHQLQHNYPDGIFWGDLRTATADAVLESWGQACGIPMTRLTSFKSRAAAIRGIFSRKQALLILDDVVDSQQALQMIPAQTLGCTVLITTRSKDIAHALTRHQTALTLAIRPMARSASLALLANILSEPTLAEAEAEKAANQIATLLGDLPLALHICAALCTTESLSINQMATLLSELHTRLDYLQLEEKPLVRLAFEQSWQLLNEKTRYKFATLAVFDGRPFTLPAFAASTGLPEPQAAWQLTQLCNRSLVTIIKKDANNSGQPHYQQHTLLATFANEKLANNDSAWERFSHYFHTIVEQPMWWKPAPQETWGHVMAGMAVAHRLNLWPLLSTYTTRLTEAWRRQGQYSLARQGFAWALEGAQKTTNIKLTAQIHLEWGRACLEQSSYTEARSQLTEALRQFLTQEQTLGIAEVHYYLARLEMEQNDYDQSEVAVQKAYRAYQKEEDVRGMARSLYRLGDVMYARGNYERTITLVVDAIRSQQQAGDVLGLMRSHRLAVQTFIQLKQLDKAKQHCQVVAQLVRKVDDQAELANYHYVHSDLVRRQGDFALAKQIALKALALFRAMADGSSEANALLMLAGNELNWNEADASRQGYETGVAYCNEGLAICETIDYKLGKTFLLSVRGQLEAQQGNKQKACDTWSQALPFAQVLQNGWLQQELQTFIGEAGCSANRLPNPPLADSLGL